MPWLQSAADRGEPRAMYVLGVASYNGDYAPKDWVRAYALISRAAATGLQQAVTSLATMNETIPLAQRQMGVSLASELEQKAADTRGRELAAADLGTSVGPVPSRPAPAPAPLPTATPIERVDLPPSAPGTSDGTGIEEPAPEDRAYTAAPPRPAAPVAQPPRQTAPKPAASKPAAPQPAAKPAGDTGTWRVQLGAFGTKSNADALWARVRGRPEIAGHARADVGSPVARLLATGYSQAGAQRACVALKAGGFTCLVTSN
jgi:cell division septation protein DedD